MILSNNYLAKVLQPEVGTGQSLIWASRVKYWVVTFQILVNFKLEGDDDVLLHFRSWLT